MQQTLSREAQLFVGWVSGSGRWVSCFNPTYLPSIDTKIIFKILELLLFPIFDNFARCNQLKIEGCISLMQKYQQSAIISDP
ncbi:MULTISPECIES: type II restriction endonuclease [Microcystis]|uniref:type II restriction endonuclease n=1 Tax=Microcystis TaxID=1125 RepID=UPI0032C3F0C5